MVRDFEKLKDFELLNPEVQTIVKEQRKIFESKYSERVKFEEMKANMKVVLINEKFRNKL